LDKKPIHTGGDLPTKTKMPKIKTPAELARECALQAAANSNITGLENLDLG